MDAGAPFALCFPQSRTPSRATYLQWVFLPQLTKLRIHSIRAYGFFSSGDLVCHPDSDKDQHPKSCYLQYKGLFGKTLSLSPHSFLNILIYAINICIDFVCFLAVLGVEHMALNMSGNDSTTEPRVFIIYSVSFWSISLHKWQDPIYMSHEPLSPSSLSVRSVLLDRSCFLLSVNTLCTAELLRRLMGPGHSVRENSRTYFHDSSSNFPLLNINSSALRVFFLLV